MVILQHDLCNTLTSQVLNILCAVVQVLLPALTKKNFTNDGIIKHKFKKNGKEVTFRILRFSISNNTTEVLVTNIFEEFSTSNFKELYNMRWGIEKTYNCIKNRFGLESFSGTKPVCILQDFYANLYLYNALAMLMYGNNNKTPEKKI